MHDVRATLQAQCRPEIESRRVWLILLDNFTIDLKGDFPQTKMGHVILSMVSSDANKCRSRHVQPSAYQQVCRSIMHFALLSSV